MPVRSIDVPTITVTDSPGSSMETRNSPKMNPFGAPLRSSTFIVGVGVPTPRSSMTSNQSYMSPHSSTFNVEEKAGLELQPSPKLQKSIGKKIMSLSMKQGRVKPLVKKTSGSTLQKTISKAKNTNTPGSVYKSKFGVAKKLPNFKSIHQRLFKNMESIDDNKQRTMERAQALISSPAVPRCALLSPKTGLVKDPTTSKEMPVSSFLSPLVRTPARSTTKAQVSTVPGPSSVNRFGFKKPVKRLESSIIAKKLPNTNLAKVKNQERQVLQGVRMNKRFLLQMKMREGK
uniref:Uncharacterized protein n=1 Tax=Graphocephala atropunctata TaxID=36148 RepID=A0A1B6L1Y2_9HEMI